MKDMSTKALVDAIIPYEAWLRDSITAHGKLVNAHMNSAQLALLAAHWHLDQSSTCVITGSKNSSAEQLHRWIESWTAKLGMAEKWHAIPFALTEQEETGVVITDLATTYHHLLLGSPNHHFVLDSSMLAEPAPSRAAYTAMQLSVAVGEHIRLTNIVEYLATKGGYVRSHTSLEAGTMRIRGETIDIAHPVFSGHFSISFHGSQIEKIVHVDGKRSVTLRSLLLPPNRFPADQSSWEDMLSPYLVFQPSYEKPFGSHTIITDALAPDVRFSVELPALEPKEEYVPMSPISYQRALELIGKLEEGKPAVHADHGIGMYEGLSTKNIDATEREYIVLRYAEGDAIWVPVEYAHKVSPYIGEGSPPIYRLGGTLWAKTRKKAQEDAARFAKELLSISKRRQLARRDPYAIRFDTEQELNESFAFTLTLDQARVWQEVLNDLQASIPMNRLVVGDVGFGKTEIAVRAAYHVAANGKQVAVLCPTTLLAQQHYDTFVERLPALKNKIGLLARFVPTRLQARVHEQIREGVAAIVVGTHALVSSRVEWKNLGLVIIDEEQRFGVKQKEYFKALRSTVDVLSLSATPIPRTLSMALSGLTTLSTIATPPEGRKDVETKVVRLSDSVLRDAIEREVARGGKVFIVAPKIAQLSMIRIHVESLVHAAHVAIAHGQLPDEELANIVHAFDKGEVNVLVSSSIIENGLDVPGADTIIVWRASHFGLSDLYQLRGRIGRRTKKGYAYFLYNQEELTSVQRQRLSAITQASRLGSGWEIARRDLEIRGAGNLLGAEQSGSMNAVGAQLYLDMIRRSSYESAGLQRDVDIELPLTSLIPRSYIGEVDERIMWYQRISRSQTPEQLDRIASELAAQFGDLPQHVQHLLLSVRLQRAAGKCGITKISGKTITPPDEYPYEILEITGEHLPRLLILLEKLGHWTARENAIRCTVKKITTRLLLNLTLLLENANA